MVDPLKDLPSETEERSTRQELKDQRKISENLAKVVDSLSSAQFKLKKQRRPPKPRGSYLRVIFGDTHGQHVDQSAWSALIRDVEKLMPKEVVILGDLIDCGGWLSEHPTLHMSEITGSYEDDITAGNQMLDMLQTAAPKARIHYLEGNHEWRVVKTILKWVKGNKREAAYLLKHIGIKRLLNLQERGIDYIKHDEQRDGLEIRGAIKLGDWVFTHGPFRTCGVNAVRTNLSKLKCNFAQGHIHRMVHEVQQSAIEKQIHGFSFGHLGQHLPYYMENNTTNWCHGYGVQNVHADGSATTWPVEIRNGISDITHLWN